MFRSLRKGSTTLEISSNGHFESINAIKTTLSLQNNILLLSTTLKPVDENQRDDANFMLNENKNPISKIIIRDRLIREKIESFVNAHKNEIKSIKTEILYEKHYSYNVKITIQDNDTLIMTVQ